MFYFLRPRLNYFQLVGVDVEILGTAEGVPRVSCPDPCASVQDNNAISLERIAFTDQGAHRLDLTIEFVEERYRITNQLIRYIRTGSTKKSANEMVKLRKVQALAEYFFEVKRYFQEDCDRDFKEVAEKFKLDCIREDWLCRYGLQGLYDEMLDATGVKELCLDCAQAIYTENQEPITDTNGTCIQHNVT